MPPIRSMPKLPNAPLKTERSHLENVERAYVAASRRSDRSLEARIESARRASEIHKQRTGRSLRITESAVVNEEMYEEDDDDLPSHLRRLTAHLRLSEADADLDRRLGNLLASQIGMRQAFAMPPRRASYASLQQQSPHSPYPSPHLFQQNPSPLFNSGYSYNPNAFNNNHNNADGTTIATSKKEQLESSPAHQGHPITQASPYSFQNFSGPDQGAFSLDSPLSSTLPLSSQHLLAGSSFDLNDPSFNMFMPGNVDNLLGAPEDEPVDDLFHSQSGDVEALFNDMVAYGS